jgi:uncharacterized Zn finger protein
MDVQESEIRDLCVDAVFQRGEAYYTEGRIENRVRVGDRITARVRGSRLYEVSVTLSAASFGPSCDCPYDGPGECKHVAAVLLSLARDPPVDDGPRIDAALTEASDEALREFLRAELVGDVHLFDRFLARFGDDQRKSHEAYRAEVEQLFSEYADESGLVVAAIDFSHFLRLGELYRNRERYEEAAAVYRGLVTGIDEQKEVVETAYEHYRTVFENALDAYVECVSAADLSASAFEGCEQFLAERAEIGAPGHREQFRDALSVVRSGDEC